MPQLKNNTMNAQIFSHDEPYQPIAEKDKIYIIRRIFARLFDLSFWGLIYTVLFYSYSYPYIISKFVLSQMTQYQMICGHRCYFLSSLLFGSWLIILLSLFLTCVTNGFISGIFHNTIGKMICGVWVFSANSPARFWFYMRREINMFFIILACLLFTPLILLLFALYLKLRNRGNLRHRTIAQILPFTKWRMACSIMLWGLLIGLLLIAI